MKRNIIRFSALAAVLGLGGLAIVHFPRAEQAAEATTETTADGAAPETQPAAVVAAEETPPSTPKGDPFAARGLMKSSPAEPGRFDADDTAEAKPIRPEEFTQERPWPGGPANLRG